MITKSMAERLLVEKRDYDAGVKGGFEYAENASSYSEIVIVMNLNIEEATKRCLVENRRVLSILPKQDDYYTERIIAHQEYALGFFDGVWKFWRTVVDREYEGG